MRLEVLVLFVDKLLVQYMHLLGGIERQRLSMCFALVCCCGAPRNQLSKTAPLRKACISLTIPPPFQRVRQKT